MKRYIVLIASCFAALCIGSLYAWSVFASPMKAHLQELTGDMYVNLTSVFTLANSVGPVTMISGGFINDRIGSRPVLLIGAVLFGGGMILSGYACSVNMLLLSYGLGVGLGCGLIYGVIVSNAVKSFSESGGLAGGLITACYGGSSVIVPLVTSCLLKYTHITNAFKILGVGMLVVLLACAMVIRPCPKNKEIVLGTKSIQANDCSTPEMLKSKNFYLMLLTLLCGAFSGMMLISHASAISMDMMHYTAEAAALIVSVLALFNTAGRLICGAVSDRLGPVFTLQLTLAGSAIASLVLYFCEEGSNAAFLIALILTGFCFGSIMGIYPGFTARVFGRRNNSMNYGIMFTGFALASLLAPMIIDQAASKSGNYQIAFLISALFAVFGELPIFIFSGRNSQGNP